MALNYNFNDANSPLRGLEEVSPNAAASRKSKVTQVFSPCPAKARIIFILAYYYRLSVNTII